MSKHVVVIGAGVAGMEAAGRLSRSGFNVTVIEKENIAGGHLNNWYKLFPDRRASSEVKQYLDDLVSDSRIKIVTGSEITKFIRKGSGYSVNTNQGEEIVADAVIIATGFDLFRSSRKEEYGYGIYDNVITSADLEKMFRENEIN